MVLNREVGVQISGLDRSGNLIGMLLYSRNDLYRLYNELLVVGAAKISTFISDLPVDVRVEFEQRQDDAQSERTMIWKSLDNTIDESLTGTVLEVYSGDCIGVIDDEKQILNRLNLAGIKAPNMGSSNQEAEPWAHESKMFLINLVLGKKVTCKIEFNRTTQNGFKLLFSTVFLSGDAENLSAKVVGAGMANVANPRDSEPELP